jgi:hypothetical protein
VKRRTSTPARADRLASRRVPGRAFPPRRPQRYRHCRRAQVSHQVRRGADPCAQAAPTSRDGAVARGNAGVDLRTLRCLADTRSRLR